MSEPDRCRFCRLFAWALLGFSALFGVLTCLHSASLETFLWFVESTLRALAPAAVGSALLLGLVLWAQPLAASRMQGDLKRILTRGLVVSLPGYVLAAVSILAVGSVVSMAMGLPGSVLAASFAKLPVRALLLGVASTACDAGLVVVLAWRFLPRLHAAAGSLPMKLVFVLSLTTPLRAVLGLLTSNFF